MSNQKGAQISSPDQLHSFMRVTNPSVWIIFGVVIVLLIGMCVWSIVGRLETKVAVALQVSDTDAVCYVLDTKAASVSIGDTVRVGNTSGTVTAIAPTAVQVDENFDDYLLHLGNLQAGDWCRAITVDATLTPGIYSAEIVTDTVAPISFVTN